MTLLADQRRLLPNAFSNWHGHEVDNLADAFFVTFLRLTQALGADALLATAAVNRPDDRLTAHRW